MTARTERLRSATLTWVLALVALFVSACGGAGGIASARDASAAVEHAELEAPGEGAEAAGAPAPPRTEAPAEPSAPSLFDSDAVAQAPAAAATDETADVPSQKPGAPALVAAQSREPLLVYTATLTLAVFGTRDALAAVENLARAHGGYLVRRGDDSITVRVPTKAFRTALEGVGKLGDELHREVSVEDVTERFADLEIRLKNAEAVRRRLEALLEKAARIEDALAVERELERVTQTIEQLKGKLRQLSELIRFSTITVNFRARPQDQVGSEVRLPFEWLGGLGLPQLLNLEAP